jgi:hypothetical protein
VYVLLDFIGGFVVVGESESGLIEELAEVVVEVGGSGVDIGVGDREAEAMDVESKPGNKVTVEVVSVAESSADEVAAGIIVESKVEGGSKTGSPQAGESGYVHAVVGAAFEAGMGYEF